MYFKKDGRGLDSGPIVNEMRFVTSSCRRAASLLNRRQTNERCPSYEEEKQAYEMSVVEAGYGMRHSDKGEKGWT